MCIRDSLHVGTTSQAENPSITISSLDNATRYYFRVTAVNGSGYEGTGSKSIDITPTYSGPVWWVSTSGSDSDGEGSSAAPYTSIRRALERVSSGDTIMLKAGTFSGPDNRNIEISAYGDKSYENFDFLKNVVITSEKGADSTIIDAEYSGMHFMIYGDDSRTLDSTFQFIGLTFTKGRNNIDNAAGNDGGGSFVIHAEPYYDQGLGYDRGSKMQPKFKNCVFTDNEAIVSNNGFAKDGGAIILENASAIFENCTFEENVAGHSGGAISVKNSSQAKIDTLWVRNTSFISNSVMSPNSSSQGAKGGAIGFRAGTNAVIINSLFEKNMTTSNESMSMGGAIFISNDWNGSVNNRVWIINSRITKNTAKPQNANSSSQGAGGGFFAASPFVMVNTVVDSNVATAFNQGSAGMGGGLFIDINFAYDFNGNQISGDFHLVNNTIANNIAEGPQLSLIHI